MIVWKVQIIIPIHGFRSENSLSLRIRDQQQCKMLKSTDRFNAHFAPSVSAQICPEHLLIKPDSDLKKRRLPDKGRNKIKRSRWLQFFILNLAIYPDSCVILSAAEIRGAHASCSHILPVTSGRTSGGAADLRGGALPGDPAPAARYACARRQKRMHGNCEDPRGPREELSL